MVGVWESRGKCRIVWYVEGKRYTRTLSIPYTAAGIKRAESIRKQILENGEPEQEKPCPTFGELAQERLDTAKLSPETRRTQKVYLNKYWRQWFPKRIDRIHHADILMIQSIQKSPKTVRHIISAGYAVFEMGVKRGLIKDNPAKGITVDLPVRNIDPFTREERDAILDSLHGHQHLFYAIRFYCGLRPSEVIALRWADYRDGQFHVTKGRVRGSESNTTKNKKDRIVPVHPYVRGLLKKHPRSIEGHIIVNQYGQPYQQVTRLSEAFVRVLKRLGVRYRSPYNVRHTCATMMLEAGMKPAYCAKVLGHTQQQFFATYADWIDKDESERQQKKWEEFA